MMWIADVSEFQSVDWTAFTDPAVIVRATYSTTHVDHQWAYNAPFASRRRWWAAYTYMAANDDPAACARFFMHTLGGYTPNLLILDLEEGTGDQQGRQHTFLETCVRGFPPEPEWTYSGDYFARAHNLDHVEWIAAYQNYAPTAAHDLWQASDNHFFDGIGNCDGSIFNGTIDDLITLTGPKEDDDMAAALLRLDTGEVIAIPHSGAKPWHVPNPFVETLGQMGGSLENPQPVPQLTPEQSNNYRVFV